MCTAITYRGKDTFFGRNLDYIKSFGEKIIITPRHFVLTFRYQKEIKKHYAIIGVGIIEDNYPLYYDAMNECGLAVAALQFVNNAFYRKIDHSKDNIASFELILWILSQCQNIKEAKALLKKINVCHDNFKDNIPTSELHWMITDNKESIVLETTEEGTFIMQNKMDVLTNNPPFQEQVAMVKKYQFLSPYNKISFPKHQKTNGTGAIGLPGDYTSTSRFIRAKFVKDHLQKLNNHIINEVLSFFDILHEVKQPYGCSHDDERNIMFTIYTICYNLNKGVIYYMIHNNYQIMAINLYQENLDNNRLITYDMEYKQIIMYQN